MTKILFASAIYGSSPILATNDDGFKDDIADMGAADMDDHVPAADIMDLTPGLWLWEGERRGIWLHDELDIDLLKSEIRPATRQDLEEMGFAFPVDTVAPKG